MSKSSAKLLLVLFLSIGLLWAKSSYGKFASGNFVSTLGATLGKIVDKNPYPWFKEFLNFIAIPNSGLFGSMVMWGEFLAAVAIILGSLILLLNPKANPLIKLMVIAGLLGGVFLNIIFWLGFGYTSPSTDSLNVLMAVVQIIGILFLLTSLSKRD